MPNEIGWGNPVDFESGYGAAAATSTEGYGTVVINSYSGETNASGVDTDNNAISRYLVGDPFLYMDGTDLYLYFELNPEYTYTQIVAKGYLNRDLVGVDTYYEGGIHYILTNPDLGDWYVDLFVYTDTETYQEFATPLYNVA